MEQVTEGSCESLWLVQWSKEGEGRRGRMGQEDAWGRVTAEGTTAPSLGGNTVRRKKPQTVVSRAGKSSSKNGSYKNTASSCFPWAPNVLHSSSVVIKAQQSH